MFGTFRRHQQWLWIVIAGITIFTFVIYFSPGSKFRGNKMPAVDLGSFNGQPIQRDDYLAALRETSSPFHAQRRPRVARQ